MNSRGCFIGMLVAALLVMTPRAWAQRPPQMDPPTGLVARDVVMAWDRSAIPGDIELWAPRTLVAHDHTNPAKRYGELFMTCNSSSDASTGRCPTEDTLNYLGNATTAVPVSLVEGRSGHHREVEFRAMLYRLDPDRSCSSDFWRTGMFGIHSSKSDGGCSLDQPVGTGQGLVLRSSELSRLTAGHWTGTLELQLRRPPAEYLATYRFNLDFTITDFDAISIYFPAFDEITPHLNLDLRYDPIRQEVAGRRELDMCLYDGLGSQSEYLGVTVRDAGPRPPGGNDFSAWHRDGGGGDDQRLDYTVALNYAGSRLQMKNGVEQQLRGVDTTALRLVKLPKVSEPVYCVPAPLTLETPPVSTNSKRSGYYSGQLNVELRVPTARP